MNCITQYVPRRQLCYIKFNCKFTHVSYSSRLIVKDIAQNVFRCAETTKKTSSANINTVAHRQKTEVFLGFFYNLFLIQPILFI